MPNCINNLDTVRLRFNGWFQTGLWAPVPGAGGRDWFEDVAFRLGARFTDAAYADCVQRYSLPTLGKPYALTAHTKAELHEALVNVEGVIVEWAEIVTNLSVCIARKKEHCQQNPDLIEDLQSAMDDVKKFVPNSAGSNARRLCKRHTRWARAFNVWGISLYRWENCIAVGSEICVPMEELVDMSDSLRQTLLDAANAFKLRQITRPPWPPWATFNDFAVDGAKGDDI